MKIGVILQARTSSNRLPRKVLNELPFGSGITVLQQIIRRLGKAKKVQEVIVATTKEKSDDAIVAVAKKEKVKYFRGSLPDVLERYYGAAKDNGLDVIVRITGDCPCVDPKIVDLVVSKHISSKADFTSNVIKRSYSDGFDVEVLSIQALEKIYHNAKEKSDREHVTAYIYKHLNEFKVVNVTAPKKLHAPLRRITLDTYQDYALICAIFDHLYIKDKYFGAQAITQLFQKKPWLDLITSQRNQA